MEPADGWKNTRVSHLSLAQRIVIVIALGVTVAIVGTFVSGLGGSPTQFGWFGYAPLTRATLSLDQPDLAPWEQLLVWIGLICLWAGSSLVLLRPTVSQHD